jgi:hypothetical protein
MICRLSCSTSEDSLRRGLSAPQNLIEEFTIVNNTDYPVSVRPGEPFSSGCKVRLKKHYDARLTIEPHATLKFALPYSIDGNGTYRTSVRLASRDFVFPGTLIWQ